MIQNIYKRFYAHVLESPGDIAVIDRNKKYTYADIDRLAQGVQASFGKDGPRRVAVMMHHGVKMIAAILGTLRSGAAYIPIEPSFPIDRVRFMLEEADADYVLVDKKIDDFDDIRQLTVSTDIKTVYDLPIIDKGPFSLAYILYTSGTTGRPKGIKVDNHNVCHYADAFRDEFSIGSGDIMLQHSVCTFDIFVEELFASLLNGAALAIPSRAVRNDTARLMDYVARNHVTIITGFPYLLQEIDKINRLPKCVRLLISGGDVLRASYIGHLKDKVMIYNTYGPSETTVCATYQRCDNIRPAADGTYPIGHPVTGTQVVILGEHLEPISDGKMGEICILGDGVSQGYIGDRPEGANFITLSNGKRLYRSGDMGKRLPDGTFTFAHRKDSQVMIWGKRVECNEVENVLCECDEVSRAAVRPVVDSQGLAHLVAYVVPKKVRDFSIKNLKNKLSRMLTSFMIPEVFVKLPTIPLTPNGKVDDRQLSTIPVHIQ